MFDVLHVLEIIRLALFGLIILIAAIYSVPIMIIGNLHNRNHVFTLNICLSSSCFGLSWFVVYLIQEIDVKTLFALNTCTLLLYSQTVFVSEAVFSLMVVSINRLFLILYPEQPFFRRMRWAAVCIAIQWIAGLILALPICARDRSVSS